MKTAQVEPTRESTMPRAIQNLLADDNKGTVPVEPNPIDSVPLKIDPVIISLGLKPEVFNNSTTSNETIDLMQLAPAATWGGGQLIDEHNTVGNEVIPWGATDWRGEARVDVFKLENGTEQKALFTHPQYLYQDSPSTIKGYFPWLDLPYSAVFEAEVGFVQGAEQSDGVIFWIFEHHRENGQEVWNPVVKLRKLYNGKLEKIKIDLSQLGGKQVRLELRVDSASNPKWDAVVWVNPVIKIATAPQLFLLEYYALSAFRGDLAVDELIGTFNLAPSEERSYKIVTTKKELAETALTSSVLDSKDSKAVKNFGTALKNASDRKYGSEKYKYQMESSFHGDLSYDLGGGEVNADLHVKGNTENVREDFAESAEQAINSQVSDTNESRREEKRMASSDFKVETKTEREETGSYKNITSKPMNMGIFQVMEEHIAFLTLVDFEIMYSDGTLATQKTVKLSALDTLLGQVIKEATVRDNIKRRLKIMLSEVLDYNNDYQSMLKVDATRPDSLLVNKKFESSYELKNTDGKIRKLIKIPGVIMKVYKSYLRKRNATILIPIQRS